jgi:hydroxymethylpyrimidine pyrophosphatase-like HAD family hydrolase
MTKVLPGVRVAVEEVGRGFLVTEHFPRGELDGEVRVVGLDEMVARPVTRVILRDTDLTARQIEELARAAHLAGVSYAVGWTGWIDLNPPGISKAAALEELRERLGVPPSGTVAVGDGGNDIAMLEWASRGVAMGDSRPDVLRAANDTTASCEDDGAAQLIFDVLARKRRHRG